jgi:hypothetical protein
MLPLVLKMLSKGIAQQHVVVMTLDRKKTKIAMSCEEQGEEENG